MSSEATPPETEAARHAAALRRLTEIGMKLAERVAVAADDPEADGADLALQFYRVSRAVRHTIVLETRLLEQIGAAQAQAAAANVPKPWDALGISEAEYEARPCPFTRQFEAEMIVGSAISRDPRVRLHDDLRGDFEELLSDPAELEIFSAEMPLAEVIATLCDKLGLAPDWSEFDNSDWGALSYAVRRDLKRLQADGFAPPDTGPPPGRGQFPAPPDRWTPS